MTDEPRIEYKLVEHGTLFEDIEILDTKLVPTTADDWAVTIEFRVDEDRELHVRSHLCSRATSGITASSRGSRARRRARDTTYLEGTIPATSPPPFAVEDGVHCVTPSELARIERPSERFVIIGAGKTALDTCVWLLERGVPPESIRWIRPREAWWMNRKFQQPKPRASSCASTPRSRRPCSAAPS